MPRLPQTKYKVKDLAVANKRNFNFNGVEYINYVDTSSVIENTINCVQKLNCKIDNIPSRARKAVDKNTIVYSSVRPNLKHYGIIKQPLENMVVSTGFITLDLAEKIAPDYFYYNLTQQKYTDFLTGIASNNTSAYPAINPSDLENLEIDIFDDLNIQQKIGNLLSVLDDKIELNNKINSELEAMARTLYDYWFIQFDFPDGNGRPYKSAGGEMVFSPALGREIPAEWGVKKIKDLVKINKKKTTPNKDLQLIDLSIMPSGTMCLNQFNAGNAFDTNMFEMRKYDILFGSIRPYLLKAGFSPFNGLVAGTIHSFSPLRTDDWNFLILTLTSKNIFDHAITSSKGTKMPVVGAGDLLDYQIAYSPEVMAQFNKVLDFREIIANNIQENSSLAELRDFLLPMLMNGQVSAG